MIKYFFGLIVLMVLYCLVLLCLSGYQFFIIILPMVSSYMLASVFFKRIHVIDKLNITFLILCCQIILITEALSLCNKITGINYLIVTAALFLLIFLLTRRGIKQLVYFDFENIKLQVRQINNYAQQNKLLSFFLCAILVSLAWRIFLIIYIPPNNWDSMVNHLSRPAHWLQNQSLRHYYARYLFHIILPFNGEILFLWTMVASKSDRFCAFIQLASYVLSGTLLYTCMRRYLNISVLASIFVTLIWYSLPEVVLESTSTQNDLVVSYFIMFSLVYFLLGTGGNTKYAILSAISCALAIGVKTTALFFMLPFAAFVLVLLAKGALQIKRFLVWCIVYLSSILVFSSYLFMQNYFDFQGLLGPKEFERLHRIYHPSAQSFFSNFFQHLFNIMTNQAGLQYYVSRLSDFYTIFVAKIGMMLFGLLHIPVNLQVFRSKFIFDDWTHKFSLSEDVAFFGAIGMLVILLSLYIPFALCKKNRKIDARYLTFSFLCIGFISSLSCFMKWDPCQSRYMIIAMLIGLPLLSVLLSSNTILLKRIGSSIIVYSVLLLIPATFMNERKPLTVLYKDKIGLRCLSRRGMEPIIRKFNSLVPLNTKIGIVLPGNSWDYPLFGEKLERKIIHLNGEAIQSQALDFLVIVSDVSLENEQELKVGIEKNYIESEKLGKIDNSEWILYKPKRSFGVRNPPIGGM